MKTSLVALALLSAAPAWASVSYQFSGTCTQRLLMDWDADYDGWVSIPCANPNIRVEVPDDYIPGTTIGSERGEIWAIAVYFYDDVWGDTVIDRGGGDWRYSALMPLLPGPGWLDMDFLAGKFSVSGDGAWSLKSEGRWPTFYEFSGTNGQFSRVDVSQVPLPGTAALLGLGLVIAARTRRH